MKQRKVYNIPLESVAEALHKCGVLVQVAEGKAITFGDAYEKGCFIGAELNPPPGVPQTLGLFFFYDDDETGALQGVPQDVHDNAKILNPNPPAKRELDTDVKFHGDRLVIAAVGEPDEVILYINDMALSFGESGYRVLHDEKKEATRKDGSFAAIVTMQLMPDPAALKVSEEPLPGPGNSAASLTSGDDWKERANSEKEQLQKAIDEKKVIPKLTGGTSRSDAKIRPEDRPELDKDEIAADTQKKMLATIAELGITKHSDPSKDPNVDLEVLAKMNQAAADKDE